VGPETTWLPRAQKLVLAEVIATRFIHDVLIPVRVAFLLDTPYPTAQVLERSVYLALASRVSDAMSLEPFATGHCWQALAKIARAGAPVPQGSPGVGSSFGNQAANSSTWIVAGKAA